MPRSSSFTFMGLIQVFLHNRLADSHIVQSCRYSQLNINLNEMKADKEKAVMLKMPVFLLLELVVQKNAF